jgi:hypothetical protein
MHYARIDGKESSRRGAATRRRMAAAGVPCAIPMLSSSRGCGAVCRTTDETTLENHWEVVELVGIDHARAWRPQACHAQLQCFFPHVGAALYAAQPTTQPWEIIGKWWSWSGSNRRPQDCQPCALPTELQPRKFCETKFRPEPNRARGYDFCFNHRKPR